MLINNKKEKQNETLVLDGTNSQLKEQLEKAHLDGTIQEQHVYESELAAKLKVTELQYLIFLKTDPFLSNRTAKLGK
jgi:hypothetical protein